MTNTTGPLDGIRVLDFSSFIAGPYAAMMLGDMGAEVVKIEPPGGDLARAWQPFLKGESRFYLGWNRNKRSICLDIASGAGREVCYKLVRRADVVIENYRCGVTGRLKIDYDSLRAINPRLIYCSTTAFGSRGPWRERPGYDPVLQSLGGTAAANARFNGGTTAICAIAVSDYHAAMLIAAGVNAALFHRTRTGEGQRVETSLLQSIMSVQSQYYVQALECEEEGGLGISPYRFFPTSDGAIFMAIATDKFWRLMCAALDAAALGQEAKYATNADRVKHAAELNQILPPYFLEKTTAEWEQIFNAAGVPNGSARTYAEWFDDPQVTAMEMNPVVQHPTIGPLRMHGLAVNFSATPGSIRRAPPMLGEHSDAILRELDYGEADIEVLRACGVVK